MIQDIKNVQTVGVFNMHESPIPGYKHDPTPDRYPTRADWPKPGATGTYKGRPVQLMEIYFQYYALFKTGPYSVMRADLQLFISEN
jgi:hypothetical protein